METIAKWSQFNNIYDAREEAGKRISCENIVPLYDDIDFNSDDIDNIIGNINASKKKRIHRGVR